MSHTQTGSDTGPKFDPSEGISARLFYGRSHAGFRAPALTPGSARTVALNALRTDENRQWRLFRSQDAAFDHCDARPGHGLRTWAFEIDTSGRRRFVTASYSTFWRTYSRILRRLSPAHYYEVIRESHAAKLYLDLEFLIKHNPNADGDAMMEAVISKCFAFAGVGEKKRNSNANNGHNIKDTIILDSTTEKKFSRHVIFKNLAFHDNLQMGEFVCRVVDDLRDRDHNNVMVFKDSDGNSSGAQVPFVDLGVYTRNRCFRLAGSSKFGKQSRLIFPGRAGYLVSISEEEFFDSLVCNVGHDQKLLGKAQPPGYADSDGRLFKRARTSTEAGTSTMDRYACSPYKRLDDYIRSIVHPHNGNIYGVTVTAANDTIMYAIKGGYKYCANIGRHHKSNNVILIADLRFRLMTQKCFDPDCRGFRSDPWHIPQQAFEPSDNYSPSGLGEDESVSDEVLVGVMEDFERKHGDVGGNSEDIEDLFMVLAMEDALQKHFASKQGDKTRVNKTD